MATSQIGGVQYETLRGLALNPIAQTLQNITRANVDGHSFRQRGKRAIASTCTSVSVHTSAANVATAVNAAKALQGTLVTVFDDNDNTATLVAVVNVEHLLTKRVATSISNHVANGTHLLFQRWDLLMTT